MSEIAKTPVVLITRPQDQVSDFKAKIEDLGAQTLESPMLKIRPVSYDTENLPIYDGLIFTSLNALRYFIPHAADKSRPCICVGSHLTQLLKNAGFNVVASAPTAEALIETRADFDLQVSSWLYVRGRDVSFDMKMALEPNTEGKVTELIVYAADKVEQFPEDVGAALERKEIDVVTFFSKRTAQAFVEAVENAKLSACLGSIKVLCIRETVLECVQPALWCGVYVSKQPTLDSMVESLRLLINAQTISGEK